MIQQILISVGGIALTILAAWGLGFRRNPVLADTAEAQRIAAQTLHGFRPVAADLTVGGRGATVRGADGRIATVSPLGDRWVVRVA